MKYVGNVKSNMRRMKKSLEKDLRKMFRKSNYIGASIEFKNMNDKQVKKILKRISRKMNLSMYIEDDRIEVYLSRKEK